MTAWGKAWRRRSLGATSAGKIFISGLDADTASLRLIAQGVQTMTVWTDLDEEGPFRDPCSGRARQGTETGHVDGE